MNTQHSRPAAVAGSFYPAQPAALVTVLTQMLGTVVSASTFTPSGSSVERPERLKALIVPHAGYVYSGPVAASAYALLQPLRGTIRRVVLLGPCHRVAVRGLAVPTCDRFCTPLGEITLDRAAIDALAILPQIVSNDAAHAQEHSLEVQLPFLQQLLGDFMLVPLAVGEATTEQVAEVIGRLWGGAETLLVISSDLSHFHTYDEAGLIDAATVQQIARLELLTRFEQACGALPINGMLVQARQRGLRIEVLDQRNSGDAVGDKSRVVGYASFALYEPRQDDHKALGAVLLALARNAISTQLGLKPAAVPDVRPLALALTLTQPGATFVTLMQHGALRGCIGSLEAHRLLADDVAANAVAAAFRDPRFPPLTAAEFATTRVEVSLLSPSQPMQFSSESDALQQLRPGEDGIIFMTNGGRTRSTFLPQVWEQLPDPRDFMSHLKQKAGLPADYWSPDVQLHRYTVSKWKEVSTETAQH